MDEFYEQAGSLFVEAYDAPEAAAFAGRTPNKIFVHGILRRPKAALDIKACRLNGSRS